MDSPSPNPPVMEACPEPEVLRCFSAGEMDDRTFERIASHVETCDRCGQTIMDCLSEDPIIRSLSQEDPFKRVASEEPYLRSLNAALEAANKVTDGTDSWIPAGRPPVPSLPTRLAEQSPAQPPPPRAQPAWVSPGQAPLHIDNYRVLEELGRGTSGVVYKAIDEHLGCHVAIKVIESSGPVESRMSARFANEKRAIGGLDHPNIVRARTAGRSEGIEYLVMDYVDGEDLKAILRRQGRLSISDACAIIAQAAAGLQAVHEAGLVHRDIKPSNLIIDRRSTVKILDLGLVHGHLGSAIELAAMTRSQALMGTVDYLAREQAIDARQADIRSDIYSLGCTLFELLTGRPPFAGEAYNDIPAKLQGHRADPPPLVTTLRAEVPSELAALIDRMLAKEPAHRPATPALVREMLLPFTGSADLAAVVPRVSASAAQSRHVRPNSGRFRTLLLILAIAGSALAVNMWFNGSAPTPAALQSALRGPMWFQEMKLIRHPAFEGNCGIEWSNTLSGAVIVPIARTDGCLIQMGTLQQTSFILRVEIQQTHWRPDFGVFMGYRTITFDRRKGAAVQLIRVIGSTAYQMRRGTYRVMERNPTYVPHISLAGGDTGLMESLQHDVKLPAPGATALLEIRVEDGQLVECIWNGNPITGILGSDPEHPEQAMYFLGDWGLYTVRNMVVKGVQVITAPEELKAAKEEREAAREAAKEAAMKKAQVEKAAKQAAQKEAGDSKEAGAETNGEDSKEASRETTHQER